MAAVCLLFLSGATAWAQPAIADVQWAQRVLTEKGFDIGGRANGQMTAPTRSALKAYQKSAGIPVTGELDQATIDRMMAGRPSSPTQGSLSAPRPGSTPRAPEKDVKPKAAPSQRVQVQGGGENTNPALAPQGSVDTSSWIPERSGPASSGGGNASSSGLTDGVAGQVSGTQTTLPVSVGGESSTRTYARSLIAAVLVGTMLALGGAWWLSGRRRRSSTSRVAAPVDNTRREPTFGTVAPPTGARHAPLLSASRPVRR